MGAADDALTQVKLLRPRSPSSYGPPDFRRPDYWRLRGKLDVPKERFIAVTEVPGRGASRRSTAGQAGPRSSV